MCSSLMKLDQYWLQINNAEFPTQHGHLLVLEQPGDKP